jgi:tRNA1Val (adenine37-N6)-methyltransferase
MKVTTDGCLFGAWVAEAVSRSILDIGTGTGLLSLMIAQKDPLAEIDALEIDAEAARQAQANADASPWKENIFVMPGDARDSAFVLAKEYDIIVSNPPFYESELHSPDPQKNIAHHGTGLLLEDLLQIIAGVLSPTGRFYLLLPAKRMTEAGLLSRKYDLTITATVTVRPSTRHQPFRIFMEGKRKSNDEEANTQTEIPIRDEEGKYTETFVRLLKEYYLHL